MGLRKVKPFSRRGRKLPGQSSDEELGLERNLTIKVAGDTAVINQSLIRIGDVGSGNYLELGPEGITLYNEGTETELWADIDGGVVQSEFRTSGKDAGDPDAHIALVATNYNSTAQNSFTLDTSADRATLDAEVLLIGQALRLTAVTTAQRNALTAVNGMVVYNSTSNKFQGYAGGSWVDLH